MSLKPIRSVLPSMSRFESIDEDEVGEDFKVSNPKIQVMYTTLRFGLTTEFNLSPIEAILLSTIITLSKKKGFAYAGQERYSRMMNVTKVTIRKTIRSLTEKYLIQKLDKKGMFGTSLLMPTPMLQDQITYLETVISRDKKEKRGERA